MPRNHVIKQSEWWIKKRVSTRIKNGNYKKLKESKEKQSQTRKKLSREGKLNIWNRGKPWSDETKKKLSLAHLGRSPWNKGIHTGIKPWLGKERSQETKNKLSLAHKGKRYSINTEFKKGSIPWGKGKTLSKETKEKIRQARFNQKNVYTTKIEIKIQSFLKELGIEFFTHQWINQIEHDYSCDILIPSMNLIIETDGNYWHHYPIGNDLDHIRTKELLEKGFKVLRLWEIEIKEMDIDGFRDKLKSQGQTLKPGAKDGI